MDSLFQALVPPQFFNLHSNSSTLATFMLYIIPYAIVTLNFILFKLLRSLCYLILDYFLSNSQLVKNYQVGGSNDTTRIESSTKGKLIKLFIDELLSTCELCADCAELNVVYERHGSWAYGASLFLLSYLWIDSFGDAHTTPCYLFEDLMLVQGNRMLKQGDAYARFIGQSLAMPAAWRLASFYWKYQLLNEHQEYLMVDNCKSALTISTIEGFLIEFGCCLICRLIELLGHKLHENNWISQRLLSVSTSFSGTLLVVLAFELSGGYFNPILASSLEYGCKGIEFYQHAVVFWLGPLLGHLFARALYRRYGEPILSIGDSRKQQKSTGGKSRGDNKRLTRSASQKSKRKHHVD